MTDGIVTWRARSAGYLLGRDYYVRIAGNDYSVNPTVIGRFVGVLDAVFVVPTLYVTACTFGAEDLGT